MEGAERLVLIGPSRQAVEYELRELTIPVGTLVRGGAVLVIAESELERSVRGMGHHIWATTPGHVITDMGRTHLAAHRGRETGFHEAVARHLA